MKKLEKFGPKYVIFLYIQTFSFVVISMTPVRGFFEVQEGNLSLHPKSVVWSFVPFQFIYCLATHSDDQGKRSPPLGNLTTENNCHGNTGELKMCGLRDTVPSREIREDDSSPVIYERDVKCRSWETVPSTGVESRSVGCFTPNYFGRDHIGSRDVDEER